MGGRGSGRNGAVPTAEALLSLTLDVNVLLAGFTRARGISKRFEWRGRGTLSVEVPPFLYEPQAMLRFEGSRGGPADWQSVPLVCMPAPLGGVTWYFVCPILARRCRRLILPAGRRLWASRRGYGLGYASQRETDLARAVRHCCRLELKITEGRLNRRGRRVRFQRRTLARLHDDAMRAMRVIDAML